MYTILFSILFSAFITASTWNDITSPTQTKTKLEASSDDLDITSINFDIDDCKTQRNLNSTGINQSKKIGIT